MRGTLGIKPVSPYLFFPYSRFNYMALSYFHTALEKVLQTSAWRNVGINDTGTVTNHVSDAEKLMEYKLISVIVYILLTHSPSPAHADRG